MRKLIGPALILMLAGCGGEDAPEAAAADPFATAGDEALDDTPAAEPPAERAAPAPSGAARLTVEAQIDGEPAEVHIQLVDPNGDVAHEGRSGKQVSVPPGRYNIIAKIDDAALLVDKPTRRVGSVILAAGDEVTEEVEIGRARVRLRVVKGGRAVSNARVELRASGTEQIIYEYSPGNDHIGISPGRYDALVHLPKSKVEVNGLVFQPGARQNIPIEVR
jgi:hypothetical protein